MSFYTVDFKIITFAYLQHLPATSCNDHHTMTETVHRRETFAFVNSHWAVISNCNHFNGLTMFIVHWFYWLLNYACAHEIMKWGSWITSASQNGGHKDNGVFCICNWWRKPNTGWSYFEIWVLKLIMLLMFCECFGILQSKQCL